MTELSFSRLVLIFVIYSSIGWLCETLWCSVGSRKLVNRGFLTGPWCPIYGFGGLLILFLTPRLEFSPILVFLVSVVSTSVLEYFTGWLLESLFQTRWWDYSHNRFNIKGRVCLLNSLMFGILGLVLVYLVQPLVVLGLDLLSAEAERIIASLLFAVIGADLVRSVASVTALRERMEAMRAIFAELEEYQEQHLWFDRHDLSGSIAALREICQDESAGAQAKEILAQIDRLDRRKDSGLRMLKAFPNMQSSRFSGELDAIRQEWKAGRSAIKESSTRLRDRINQDVRAAYRGMNLTRIVWVFLVGCVVGYLAETLYCLLTLGVIESRQGMLYGPFSQVYGFGAVVFMLLLAPLAQKSSLVLFLGSAVIGGLFEAACSLVQELVWGTVSWQYSELPFSLLGGRTSLLYMFFWGILGLLYMRRIYPRILRLIDKFTLRPRRTLTIIIAVGLSLNMLLSAVAVDRWTERRAGVSAETGLDTLLDERYPDSFMEKIYPNMMLIN